MEASRPYPFTLGQLFTIWAVRFSDSEIRPYRDAGADPWPSSSTAAQCAIRCIASCVATTASSSATERPRRSRTGSPSRSHRGCSQLRTDSEQVDAS
jgi:hypothetical protein